MCPVIRTTEMTGFSKFFNTCRRLAPKREEFTGTVGLVLTGISLVIILLTISLLVIYVQRKHLRELNSYGFTLTDAVAGLSVNGPGMNESDNLLKILDIMGSRSGLVYGMIMDVHGKVTAHTDSRLVGDTLYDPAAKKVIASNNPLRQVYDDPLTGHSIYEFSRPVYHNGKKTGVVRLGFTNDIDALLSDGDIEGLLALAALIFSLVPISYYLMRNSLRPLVSVNDELRLLIEKNEFKKINVNTGNDMGRLAGKFNQVLSRLTDRCEKLSISYEDVEVSNKILSYEKDRVESILDNIGDGIIVTDSLGRIILVNQTMANMMKFKRQEVIGKTINACFAAKDKQEILSFIEKNQFYGNVFSHKSLEIALKQSEGENIVRLSYQPLLGPEESVTGNILSAKDITVQKIAQQNQSDFIAHVSHELRTPLNTIKSYVEMLMDDEVSSRETKLEFYNTINEETDRLARLINNLLNISKIEMGSLMINRDMVKPREFFEDIFKSVENQAVVKGIKREFILPDKLSSLVIDKDLARVAILNLLGNAIKYTPEGGAITFKAEEDEDHIRIDIADTGYGISEDELPHIFDKFFRSSDEKIKAQTGNGLGLALSREIIRLHDGEIAVASEVGRGTHFTLTLPKEDSPRIKGYNRNYHSLTET
ncbi:MAG: PAS domain S-box protein [Nitrospirae bacterium]|nr:PAS domain S-box protein [Nitrospirota bacterium]